MARIGLGLLCLGLLLGRASGQIQAAAPAAAKEVKGVKLSECTVYCHASSGTLIATQGRAQYYGTGEQVVPFVRGERTQRTADGLVVKYTNATDEDGHPGLLMYCGGVYRFYEASNDAAWATFAKGKNTIVTVCTAAESKCDIPLPCGTAAKAGAASARATAESNIVTAGAEKHRSAAAPGVVTIENEQLQPGEAMVFTRSVLLEEGNAVAVMSRLTQNIESVRNNMNTFRIGYSLPAKKVGERHIFDGSVKAWRAPNTGAASEWPPREYRASRDEAIRRAKMLEPILLAEPVDEMNNLRVYYFPMTVGHDGRQYTVEPTALAFFIHPTTGFRMTVMARGGRTFGAVNQPLACTSQLYVQDVASYNKGPLGIVTIYVPSVFYSKTVRFDMEPFGDGDNFDGLMATVLNAHTSGPLSAVDFKALFNEFCRYTGGPVDLARR
jgi:hypothetical protein